MTAIARFASIPAIVSLLIIVAWDALHEQAVKERSLDGEGHLKLAMPTYRMISGGV
jgi:hypothetical protein